MGNLTMQLDAKEVTNLPDIQRTPDTRNISIDQVGVSNIRYPLTVALKGEGNENTIADVTLSVHLPHDEKGTHMSRFITALNSFPSIEPKHIQPLLVELMKTLDAPEAFVSMKFPLFLRKKAPVTDHAGLLDYDAEITAMMTADGKSDIVLGVTVAVASLCPCSKEISDRGAHNQRSYITLRVCPRDEFIWFEDLIKIAEASASCDLYPVLKRPDEKEVTERAYDNPKFVEDIVRDLAGRLQPLLNEGIISWYFAQSINHESIHTHNAIAKIERGTRGILLKNHQLI